MTDKEFLHLHDKQEQDLFNQHGDITPLPNQNQFVFGGFAPGGYTNTCGCCKLPFLGSKSACQCEPCARAAKAKWDSMTSLERVQHSMRQAEIIKKYWASHGSEPLIIDHHEQLPVHWKTEFTENILKAVREHAVLMVNPLPVRNRTMFCGVDPAKGIDKEAAIIYATIDGEQKVIGSMSAEQIETARLAPGASFRQALENITLVQNNSLRDYAAQLNEEDRKRKQAEQIQHLKQKEYEKMAPKHHNKAAHKRKKKGKPTHRKR